MRNISTGYSYAPGIYADFRTQVARVQEHACKLQCAAFMTEGCPAQLGALCTPQSALLSGFTRSCKNTTQDHPPPPHPLFLPEPMHKPLWTLTKFPLAFRPQVKLPEVPPPTEGQDRRPTVRNRKPQDQDLITSRQKHRIEIKKLPAPTAA